MNLNKEQYRAAVHVDGPMLVLAGPGSGKTHLLVERIRMMIEDEHIPPESILVITFSNKAARQMQARFERRINDRSYPVTFGTFHAVFYHILQEYDPGSNRLITEEEQRRFANLLMDSSDLFDDDTDAFEVIGLISSYKNFGDDFFVKCEKGAAMNECEREEFIRLAGSYDRMCQSEGVIDFDDMIVMCRQLFVKHEMVLRKWQKRYRYFLVDEFQDINDNQYEVLRLLAGDSMNVFAVGDDDQSIYAFRGSRPQLMKKFLKQYRGCRQVTLHMNYRCCSKIIGAADTLIRNNTDRIERPMQTALTSKNGGSVYVVESESTAVQAEFVCDMIMHLVRNEGLSLRDIAVLYRSDHCVRMFKKAAKSHGLLSAEGESIKVMTAHASKGLEFSCVFVISLQEGLFPHYKNLEGDGVMEERRLMYVAMTRAKERLYLCSVGTEHGKRPSRFVAEASCKKRYITDRLRLIRT